jgi:hypothetical protein
MEVLKQEALGQSQFDPLKLRETLWNKLVQKEAILVCKSCSNAKVIYIQPKEGKRIEPPWDLWARIFSWLGSSPNGQKWRVFWFPAPIKRILPPVGHEVGPKHVNGGYCYPCRNDRIVVYRLEEATRVLIHEILHAACLDPPTSFLPIREATTETWAELFLVALCSEGSEQKAKQLWKIQSQWIADQNAMLFRRFGIQDPSDYAWRYTVGRALILDSLRISLPEPNRMHSHSSRLTSPEICP